ncbi:GMC oxidoreductase [Xylariomycetidae sp. FL0641]|nr:GMC oxidoreductase [Xylariomycetidae sp. FL0641]
MRVLRSTPHIGLITQVTCQTFDYVIAGAGTCGLVIANRLSEDPNLRVAVIEPGQDVRNNINVTNPALFTTAFNTSIDWLYQTVPQHGAGDRPITFHQGKAIGGTSTINGMTYVRGDIAELDAWEALGNKGWNWDTMWPYYKKSENFAKPTEPQRSAGALASPSYHGEGGNVDVGFQNPLMRGNFHELVQQSWETLGIPRNADPNGGDVRGLSIWPQTLNSAENIRADAARSYYYPVDGRENLVIINGTANRISWAESSTENESVIARGMEYIAPDGKSHTITASREVILSAGAVRSPLILEGSGVGNPRILDGLGIETKVELPGVGEYLQEQPLSIMLYETTLNNTGQTPYSAFVAAQDLFGKQTASVAASTEAKLSSWAEQVAAANKGAIRADNVEKLFRIQHDLMFHKNVSIGETLPAYSSASLANPFWLLLPFSFGSVHLTEKEAINAPAIDPKYFLVDFDLEVQIALGRLSQKFWATEPVSSVVGPSLQPSADVLPMNASDAEWTNYIQSTLTPNHHPIGTASMMSRDLGGVVDPELKVYGTSNVRVVDASVMPMQISGHLTATLYALAERAADIIRGTQ